MSTKFSVAGKTDIGLVRSGNEDSYHIIEDQSLFVVCDGMGGHKAGEVASGLACNIIGYCFGGFSDQISSDPKLKLPEQLPAMSDILVKSIRLASRAIHNQADENPEQSGMGTTVVSAVIEGNMVGIAHVGDSRAYKLTDKELIRMTVDHSWVTELQQSGLYEEMEAAGQVNKNVITRALGVHEKVEVDYSMHKVEVGDIYILCSDGLCGFAEDGIIYDASHECEKNVQKIVDTLVNLANDRGGQDNVTVVAFRIDEISGERQYGEIDMVKIGEESDETLAREDELSETVKNISTRPESEPLPTSGSTNFVLYFIMALVVCTVILIIWSFMK